GSAAAPGESLPPPVTGCRWASVSFIIDGFLVGGSAEPGSDPGHRLRVPALARPPFRATAVTFHTGTHRPAEQAEGLGTHYATGNRSHPPAVGPPHPDAR